MTNGESNYCYEDYNVLGNVRQRIVEDIVSFSPATILEIGMGSGEFAKAFVARLPNSHFMGIDTVPDYIPLVAQSFVELHLPSNCEFRHASYEDLVREKRSFDCVVLFLAWCEILKYGKVEDVATSLARLLNPGGILVICDEFESDSANERQQLGFEVQRLIGYAYSSLGRTRDSLHKAGLDIRLDAVFDTGRPALNVQGTCEYIAHELQFNASDGTSSAPLEAIWDLISDKVTALEGIEINGRIRRILARAADR